MDPTARGWMTRTALYVALLLVVGTLLVVGCHRDQPVVHDTGGVAVKPKGKVGTDLGKLYEEWTAFQHRSEHDGSSESFEPSNENLRVIDGLVIVEAVASADVASLIADFGKLGAHDVSSFRTHVSARLPIGAIPSLDGLASLKSVKPAYRRTH
jgi:hypothetical protein